ncbi:MAG: histidine--tRNA ligase [Elusimicrobiota bacterium]
MKEFKAIRGIRDILYPRSQKWGNIVAKAAGLLKNYGYRRTFIPVIEYTDLFSRSIGEDTDIVSKEMYSFEDRKGRQLSLRPEGTASVVRAAIENRMLQGKVREKFFYFGPMFRYERPQQGRYRQFYQLGCEVLGSEDPFIDAEILDMAVQLMKNLKIKDYKVKINSVGCEKCRTEYRKKIRAELKPDRDKLCPDCKKRLDSNTLRIFDCKNKKCRALYKKLPAVSEYLCNECRDYYREFKEILTALELNYSIDKTLVRGLDYYTGPVFEILSKGSAVLAGGRYDNLTKQLGGPDQPACGWALGLERISAISDIDSSALPEVYLLLIGDRGMSKGRSIARKLRQRGISVEEDYSKLSVGKKFNIANRKDIRWVVILGEDELTNNTVSLKDMKTGEQESMKISNIEKIVRKIKC